MYKKSIDMNSTDFDLSHSKTVINNKILWAPMKLVQLYLSIVFVLFVFGPWPWPVNNRLSVNSYLISAQFLLFLGYYLSLKSKTIVVVREKMKQKKLKNININKLIRILLLISIVFFVPAYMSRVGLDSFNISEVYDAFINGLLNPGEQYHYKLSTQGQVPTNTTILLITAISAPFRWLLVPLTIVHWKSIKRKYKVGVMIFLFLDTISWISIGTNKGIFDNVFILAFSVLIKTSLENRSLKNVMTFSKSKLKMIVISVSSLLAAILYLINAITSRLGKLSNYYRAANIYVNEDSFVMKIMPDFLENIVIVITSYTTQGYYALSLAMKENFTTTFGFGNSWFLLNIYEKISGSTALEASTYPFKLLKYGWDPYINWHSIYTWLASDYSFIGTLIIMVIIGYFFGEIWKSVIFKQNIYAIGLFVLMMIMFMYFPANNQIFAFTNTFSAFWGLFFLWLFSYKIKL